MYSSTNTTNSYLWSQNAPQALSLLPSASEVTRDLASKQSAQGLEHKKDNRGHLQFHSIREKWSNSSFKQQPHPWSVDTAAADSVDVKTERNSVAYTKIKHNYDGVAAARNSRSTIFVNAANFCWGMVDGNCDWSKNKIVGLGFAFVGLFPVGGDYKTRLLSPRQRYIVIAAV